MDDQSHLVGDVVCEERAVVKESVIRGPSIIGKGAMIVRSILGPYVSVYERTRIEDSEIQNSIIMEDRQGPGAPCGVSVHGVGDSSEIRIP